MTDRPVQRSLILSGGGIRLAYQAGAMRALAEAGLDFSHADATSGGAINLAMYLSGLTPVEMCDRWRTLDVKESLSLLPLREYLEVAHLTALGDSDGMRNKVFPHLGIDFAAIRGGDDIAGTFNVFDYRRKVCEVIPRAELDEDWLVAGMSLPGVLPPVEIDGRSYLDCAFVQDANLMEGVRRGAEELWLVWALGNTPTYRGGAFGLYMNMLEMSSNGGLNVELACIRELNERIARGDSPYGQERPIRLHLIRPPTPLPLDPELYLGGVDNATLISMGYTDAKRYLADMTPEGTALEPEATMMSEAQLGISFRETMAGGFALGETDPKTGKKAGESQGSELAMHAAINIDDIDRFVDDTSHAGTIHGTLDFTPFGEGIPTSGGAFNLFSPTDNPDLKLMVYEMAFAHDGKDYYLAGKKEVESNRPLDLWSDTTTLFTQLHEGTDKSGAVVGAGVLSLGVRDLIKLVSTMRAPGATSAKDKAEAFTKFGRFFLGELWDSYIKFLPK